MNTSSKYSNCPINKNNITELQVRFSISTEEKLSPIWNTSADELYRCNPGRKLINSKSKETSYVEEEPVQNSLAVISIVWGYFLYDVIYVCQGSSNQEV